MLTKMISDGLLIKVLLVIFGVVIGILFAAGIDIMSMRTVEQNAYNKAVSDILHNHFYYDRNNRYHELEDLKYTERPFK